jgi:hypothetical protein
MNENKTTNNSEEQQAPHLRVATVSRRFFSDAEDFNQFMVSEKPKEIWLDEFMEDEPYIILSFNDGVNFRGGYNHQCLLGGCNSDFTWLYKSRMYVKTFC